jgi:flagellar biosynthesis protein FliR
VIFVAIVLALRGIAAIAVLTTITGGIPRVAQAALALGLGAWSGLLVGGFVGDVPVAAWPLGWASVEIALRELAIGAALGVVAALPLVAAAIAGRLADIAAWGRPRGPYEALFGVLAAAVFVAIDGHVAVVRALVDSHLAVPALGAAQAGVLASIAALIPAAVRLAVPWLVTAAVVQIAAGASARLAGRASSHLPTSAGVPAAIAMMSAALVGTLAIGIAALVRGIV